MKLEDIDWRKGLVIRKWGPKTARKIELLCRRGLIDWQSAPDSWPGRGRFHYWHFGGMLITLTDKGKRIARSRPRCANRARKHVVG